MIDDSNPQGYSSPTTRTRWSRESNPSLCIDVSTPSSCNGNAQDLALYWRNVHEQSKKNMLQCFSAATITRSRNTVVTGQHLKHEMYRAAAESSKFELLSRNSGIRVSVNGHFVEFLGFESKHTPKKVISIDMHGGDVRSGVQFVKSLVEKCHRAGSRVNISLVVGVGNHSVRNIPKLKPAVTRYLQNNSMVRLMGCVEGRIDFAFCT